MNFHFVILTHYKSQWNNTKWQSGTYSKGNNRENKNAFNVITEVCPNFAVEDRGGRVQPGLAGMCLASLWNICPADPSGFISPQAPLVAPRSPGLPDDYHLSFRWLKPQAQMVRPKAHHPSWIFINDLPDPEVQNPCDIKIKITESYKNNQSSITLFQRVSWWTCSWARSVSLSRSFFDWKEGAWSL